MSQKQKYITKNVQFGGKRLTLFSLDGCTWSTRREELETIVERHEAAKVTAAHLRGEVIEGAPAGAEGAAKPQPAPKRKFPVGGFRTQPLQVPHPAYALAPAAQAGKVEKVERDVKRASEKRQDEVQAKPALSAKKVAGSSREATAKKALGASPKARGTSRPIATKVQAKKRAVA